MNYFDFHFFFAFWYYYFLLFDYFLFFSIIFAISSSLWYFRHICFLILFSLIYRLQRPYFSLSTLSLFFSSFDVYIYHFISFHHYLSFSLPLAFHFLLPLRLRLSMTHITLIIDASRYYTLLLHYALLLLIRHYFHGIIAMRLFTTMPFFRFSIIYYFDIFLFLFDAAAIFIEEDIISSPFFFFSLHYAFSLRHIDYYCYWLLPYYFDYFRFSLDFFIFADWWLFLFSFIAFIFSRLCFHYIALVILFHFIWLFLSLLIIFILICHLLIYWLFSLIFIITTFLWYYHDDYFHYEMPLILLFSPDAIPIIMSFIIISFSLLFHYISRFDWLIVQGYHYWYIDYADIFIDFFFFEFSLFSFCYAIS